MVPDDRSRLPASDDALATGSLLVGPLLSACAVVAATALVAVVDPHEPGHYPTCPFLAVTGRPCPLCGGLRAVNSLTSGRLAEAAGSNVLVVVGVLIATVLWARWTVLRLRGTAAPYLNPSPALVISGFAVLVLFGVVRNLPFGAALAP